MRLLRYFLILLFAALVYGAILWWPTGPMWSHLQNRLIGFCPSRNTVICSQTSDQSDQSDCQIIQRELETGNEVNRFTLPAPRDKYYRTVLQALPDGKSVLVAETYFNSPEERWQAWQSGQVTNRPQRFHILDSQTGTVLIGPLPYPGQTHPTFSPDGQWLWSGTHMPGQFIIFSAHTGKTILALDREWTSFPSWSGSFAHDGSSVATLWHYVTGRSEIRYYELPSGKEISRSVLPRNLKWGRIAKWDAERSELSVVSYMNRQANGSFPNCVYEFKVKNHELGEYREIEQLRGFMAHDRRHHMHGIDHVEAGPRWVELQHGNVNTSLWWQQAITWIDSKLGTSLGNSPYQKTAVRFLDKTTFKPVAEMSAGDYGIIGLNFFSPDGRRMASLHHKHGLMMWDADPTPRWLWALGASVLTAVLLEVLIRWRKRVRSRSSSATK